MGPLFHNVRSELPGNDVAKIDMGPDKVGTAASLLRKFLVTLASWTDCVLAHVLSGCGNALIDLWESALMVCSLFCHQASMS